MENDKPICLVLAPRQGRAVEPVPSPTFVSGEAYICPRCGREFSAPDITVVDREVCPFDTDTDSR